MIVRGWSNGSRRLSGAGYGLRLSAADRDQHFRREWTSIQIDLGPHGMTNVALSASFWRACTELRSADVGRWLITQQLAPWPKGAPPHLNLEHLSGTSFRLTNPR
ncbi:hypothetical protein SAMN04488564_112260 [Lentzea waywayandensis]|uniref:Uncharacterized protein n=1 Tax=Lentzea waywayandensis TaxID=84724 RepID=A0A1I6FDU4_9PSEU|nr:hypothetical protein SAMN04488564_112260 [Lentzea waywayandensis]